MSDNNQKLAVLKRAREILHKGYTKGTWIKGKSSAQGRAFNRRAATHGLSTMHGNGFEAAHKCGELHVGGPNEQDFGCCGQGAVGYACGELGLDQGSAYQMLNQIDHDIARATGRFIIETNDGDGKKAIVSAFDEQIAKHESEATP